MARTRGGDADPVDVVEEEFVLGAGDDPEPEPEDEIDEDGNPVEPEPEVDEDGNPVEPEPEPEDVTPAPRRGGGSQTIREQRRRAQEAEERAAKAERELAEARGFQQGIAARQVDPQAAARAEQEFWASLDLMPLSQAVREVAQRERSQMGAALQQIEFRSNERADKQSYDIAARTSKIHRDYRSQVEQILASERVAGRNPDRQTILEWRVGRDMLEKAERAAPAQQRNGARRVASQRTQPTGARGDVAAKGRGRLVPGTPEHDDWLIAEGIRQGHNLFE